MDLERRRFITMLLAHYDDGWWFWPFIPLLWFAVIATVLIVIGRRRRTWWDGRRSGEAVLAERYARGEIPEQEYHDRLKVLRDRGEK
jgi:putative membrane protein